MRFVLAVTAFALLSGGASAQCVCACIQGRSVPYCAQDALNPPICQQLCTPTLTQPLRTPILAGGGGGGGVDPQTQDELNRALTAARAANAPLGTPPGLSGAIQQPGISGTLDAGTVSGQLR